MSRVISSFLVLSPMMLSAIVVTNEYVMYNHNTGSIIEPGHTAVCNLITNNVAPWAMAGQIKPKTDLTPSTNYTDTCCSTLAASATNYTDTCCSTLAVAATNYTDTCCSTLAVSATNYTDAAEARAKAASRPVTWMPSAADVGALPASAYAPPGYDYYVTGSIMEADSLHAMSLASLGSFYVSDTFGQNKSIEIDPFVTYRTLYKTDEGEIWTYRKEDDAPTSSKEIAVRGDITSATSTLATKSAVESVSNTVAYLTATQATHTATLATKIDANDATTISESVVSEHIYYASTNLADNVELRLYSGEWVNAEYDGVGTADVILDLTGVPANKVTDTLMVLNCAATGTLRVATSTNACRVIHKKDANPLELKAGLNLLTFSRYRMVNGTNEVLVTNNEME